MADEVLKTNLAELQGKDGVLSAILLEASAERDTISQHLRMQQVTNQSDQAEFVMKPSTSAGTLTEGAAAANTAWNPTSVTVAVGEIGNLFDVSDLAAETSSLGPDGLFSLIEESGTAGILRKREEDTYALFNSLSTGVTGALGAGGALSVIDVVQAYSALRMTNHAMGPVVGHLTNTQVSNIAEEMAGTTGVIWSGQAIGQGAEGADGRELTVMGIGIWKSTLGESDGGSGKYGALLVDGNAAPSFAPFGFAWAWQPRVKTNYDASSGSTLLRASEARGVGEIGDKYGVYLLSVA